MKFRSYAWLLPGLALPLFVLACGDEGGGTSPTPTASPTVTLTLAPTATGTPTSVATFSPSPTPAGEIGGLEDFRVFAAQIEQAVADQDVQFFTERARVTELTCPSQPHEVAVCKEEQPGTVVRAFQVRNPFEGNVVTLPDYAVALEDWFAAAEPDLSDQYGSGIPTLYALAHSIPGEGMEELHAIATGIFSLPGAGSAQREVHSFTWRFLDGVWQLTYDLRADSPQAVADWLSGECGECYDEWERWHRASRTGIAEVDAVIDAVLSHDAEALRPLVLFAAKPCTSSGTVVEQPLCRPDESDGTPVDVLAGTISGRCRIAVRTQHVRPDEIDGLLGSLALDRPNLYAVYRTTALAGGPPQYIVVFARNAPEAGYEVVGARLVIEGARVVSVDLHCGETFAELVENVESQDFVLPPHEP